MDEITEERPRKRRPNPALRRRRKHNGLLCVLLLALVLMFLLANLLTPNREFSDNENRMLRQRPDFSWSALADGSYFQGLTGWYSDQFWNRDGWLSFRLGLENLLGKKESGDVYLGRDGYLLEKPEAPGESLDATIQAMNDFSAAHRDIPMNLLLAPCAEAVLPEKLPKNAPVRDQLGDIAQVGASLSGVTLLNPAFDSAEGQLYYKTDHHWTTLGAFQAFRSVAPQLGIYAIGDWNIYTVSDSFQGTLASRSGSHKSRDLIQVYAPRAELPYYVFYPDTQVKTATVYDRACLEEKDQYTVFFGGNHPLVEIHTTANNGRNLLLFKDSYANCFVPFLIPYYENIILVDARYYYGSGQELLTNYNITEVLYLYSANTFLADTSLKDVLG